MAVFLSRASQQYAARVNPYTVNATIPVGLARPVRAVKVTINHDPAEVWPEGPLAVVTLTGPNRTQAFEFYGGPSIFRGEVRNYRNAQWEVQEGEAFNAGAYALSFKVLQTVKAGLVVEYFQ